MLRKPEVQNAITVGIPESFYSLSDVISMKKEFTKGCKKRKFIAILGGKSVKENNGINKVKLRYVSKLMIKI